MAEADDKPLPNLDPPSAIEPLLKRIAEGVERLEKKQPPTPPTGMAGAEPLPPIPPSQRQADQPPPNLMLPERQGFQPPPNLMLPERQGFQPPPNLTSVFNRSESSLQSMSVALADRKPESYSEPLQSYAKTASHIANESATRAGTISSMKPSTGSGEQDILRSIRPSKRDEPADEGPSSQINRNDLKDSIDSLKESIDQLRDVVNEMNQSKTGPEKSGTVTPRGSSPRSPQSGGVRTTPRSIGIGMPQGSANASFGFGVGS